MTYQSAAVAPFACWLRPSGTAQATSRTGASRASMDKLSNAKNCDLNFSEAG